MPTPPQPNNVFAPNFKPVTHDIGIDQDVIASIIGSNGTLTASISAGAPLFQVVGMVANKLSLESVGLDELPHGHAPVTVWQETKVSSNDGATPLPVQVGQRVHVRVSLEIPAHKLPPGPVSGTLLLQGAINTSIELSGEYLAVDEKTAIGKRWLELGGDSFLGRPHNNEHSSTIGDTPGETLTGIEQDFDNGTLFQIGGHGVTFFTFQCFAKWIGSTHLGDSVFDAIDIPLGDTFTRPDGLQVQSFKFGAIVVKAGSPYVVLGAIYEDYFGGKDPITGEDPSPQWSVGFPIEDEQEIVGGRSQRFDDADYYWTAATGAHYVTGPIRDKWYTLGGGFTLGSGHWPGLPISDPVGQGSEGSYSSFQDAMIFWHPATGAHEVHGEIQKRYAQLGLAQSHFGYPTSDEQPWVNPANGRSGRISFFQSGQIGWTQQDGTVELPPETITLQQQISTPAGTALGGWVSVTLRSDGTYTFTTHLHDSGFDSYSYQIRVVLRLQTGVLFVLQHADTVSGTTGSGSRDSDHSETSFNAYIHANWPDARTATMTVSKSYLDVGLLAASEQLLEDFLKFIVLDVVAGPLIALIVVLGEELNAATNASAGPGVLPGVLVSAGTAWLLGPGMIFPALVAGVAAGAVTDALVAFRRMTASEITFADNGAFEGQVPYNRVWLTNLDNGGRKFTWPSIDGSILVNLGNAYTSPTNFTDSSYQALGQIFIHELTHAWQIAHTFFTPGLACERLADPSYNYGPPGPPFSSFTVEGQASLVDQWFGGDRQQQNGHPPTRKDSDGKPIPQDQNDPYFPYIENNIRIGQG